jgi:hypothetical protein
VTHNLRRQSVHGKRCTEPYIQRDLLCRSFACLPAEQPIGRASCLERKGRHRKGPSTHFRYHFIPMLAWQRMANDRAERVFETFKTPLLASLHSIAASICLAAVARGGTQALIVLAQAGLHCMALFCTLHQPLPPGVGSKVNAYSSVLAWVLRTVVSAVGHDNQTSDCNQHRLTAFVATVKHLTHCIPLCSCSRT